MGMPVAFSQADRNNLISKWYRNEEFNGLIKTYSSKFRSLSQQGLIEDIKNDIFLTVISNPHHVLLSKDNWIPYLHGSLKYEIYRRLYAKTFSDSMDDESWDSVSDIVHEQTITEREIERSIAPVFQSLPYLNRTVLKSYADNDCSLRLAVEHLKQSGVHVSKLRASSILKESRDIIQKHLIDSGEIDSRIRFCGRERKHPHRSKAFESRSHICTAIRNLIGTLCSTYDSNWFVNKKVQYLLIHHGKSSRKELVEKAREYKDDLSIGSKDIRRNEAESFVILMSGRKGQIGTYYLHPAVKAYLKEINSENKETYLRKWNIAVKWIRGVRFIKRHAQKMDVSPEEIQSWLDECQDLVNRIAEPTKSMYAYQDLGT